MNIFLSPEHYLYSSAADYNGQKGLLELDLLDDIWNDVGFRPMGYYLFTELSNSESLIKEYL